MIKLLWPAILLAIVHQSFQFNEVFDEELFVKPLPDGFVYSYFQFTTRWELSANDSLLHTNLVPRSLAELFYHYQISELHLSFTNGIWRYENWGFPVVDAGPGAEVWAWFEPPADDNEVDNKWKLLCGTLSGLFCASLSFVDKTNTFRPEYSLRSLTHKFSDQPPSKVRYAALPREIVCTENLTPWKKLLPCKLREGFVSLLTPDHVYSGNYHSLAVHVRKLCANAACDDFQLEIRQTVSLVQDQRLFGGKDWSIRKLFGQGMEGACILANTSKLYVDVTDKEYDMTQKPTNILQTTRGGATSVLYEYDIKEFEKKQRMFNVAVVDKKDPNVVTLTQPPPISSKRFISGVGQERGRIVTRITNTHWTELNLIVFENIPWFVPVYLHTLKIHKGEQRIDPKTVKYVPGRQRERPTLLEIALTIPARSAIELSIDFDYIFLKWQEYPPDANHGHYLQPSIISVLLPIARNYTSLPREASLYRDSFNATQPNGYFLQIRTEALLLTLPMPDFSMPYNVICLACTVVALAFGPIHNISTKKIVAKSKEPAKPNLMVKLKEKFCWWKKKQDDKVECAAEETVSTGKQE
ncbi:GPI transamidase component PIG-T [Toxorhynchites rutilus septentrionalis]|uniref:GPI transamidase component PIG-T n=1 Tax=Toxorhynchites rutilus septentrionalis TaxID=329112 RepID=UPI00247853BC|nr:GPI transamidase component PIG-T [Toxorhynchites rutilus septentrionalis]